MESITDCSSVFVTETQLNAEEFIQKKIEFDKNNKDAFYAVNLEDIYKKHVQWLTIMPRVKPYYAVKCNDDIVVLKLLVFLKANFDCASQVEIKKVLGLGVSLNRIIFANPCKQLSHICYAKDVGIDTMTFDNEDELIKIKQVYSNAKLVLRIGTDDSSAMCQFSMKFGADLDTSFNLLHKAKEMKLNIIGISFHCGSGQMKSKAFIDAIRNARRVVDYSHQLGFQMNLLDIGGGFPGNTRTEQLFQNLGAAINQALDRDFPSSCGTQIIGEPGRYYVASAYTLATNIIARRQIVDTLTDNKRFMYYINDGIYGSFRYYNDHYRSSSQPILLKKNINDSTYMCSIWGPTCDGADCITSTISLPQLEIGDWMIWKDTGAYRMTTACEFNGIPTPKSFYFMTKTFWYTIQPAFQTMSITT